MKELLDGKILILREDEEKPLKKMYQANLVIVKYNVAFKNDFKVNEYKIIKNRYGSSRIVFKKEKDIIKYHENLNDCSSYERSLNNKPDYIII